MKQRNYSAFSLIIAVVLLIFVGGNNFNTATGSNGFPSENRNLPHSNLVFESKENHLTNEKDLFLDSIQTDVFEPSWVEKTPVLSPSARKHSAMAYDSVNDKVILFGGLNGSASDILGDTWAYDYDTNLWEEMKPSTSPPPTWQHAMVYNPDIQKIVMFGGAETLTDTWTYDYSTNLWEQQFPEVSPSFKLYHSMVYDTNRRKVILMGGTVGPFETWEMDSTTFNWTNLFPVTPLPLLFAFAASYDQANDKIVVFGGQTTSPINTGDTYAYDYSSNEWILLTPSVSPSDRRFYGRPMGYDVQSQKSVFFGGITNDGNSDEVWTFDYSTTSWELISTASSPSARWIHTMVFSSNANKFIMFGGTDVAISDQTFVLSVSDSDPPVIIGPEDKLTELGNISTSNNITWILEDLSPASYAVTQNGTVIAEGDWQNGEKIVVNLGSLPLGHHIFEITVIDTQGNTASDTVLVNIFDPGVPTISSPGDMDIIQGDPQEIIWYISDNNPTFYVLEVNQQVLANSSWVALPFVQERLESYIPGYYNFTLTLHDASSNIVSDTVIVQIYVKNLYSNTQTSQPPSGGSSGFGSFPSIPPNVAIGAGVVVGGTLLFAIIRRMRGSGF